MLCNDGLSLCIADYMSTVKDKMWKKCVSVCGGLVRCCQFIDLYSAVGTKILAVTESSYAPTMPRPSHHIGTPMEEIYRMHMRACTITFHISS